MVADCNLTSEALAAPERALCVVVLVTGDPLRVERDLFRTYESLSDKSLQIVCVLDGPVWATLPGTQSFLFRHPETVVVAGEEIEDHPGVLLNRALPHVGTEYLTVLWPGVEYHGKLQELVRVLKTAPEAGLAFCRVKAGAVPGPTTWADIINYGHLQLANLISLAGTVYRTSAVREVGGCDPHPVFQRVPGWDLALRVSRSHGVHFVPLDFAQPRWDWDDYPLVRSIPVAADLVHRCVVKTERYGGPSAGEPGIVGLVPADATRVASWARRPLTESHYGPRPLRVIVTGSIWEPIHNQLCFFNYFETEPGRQRFDWRPLLEEAVTESDLKGCDLLIMSRGRGPNVPNILDWCEARRIPTLYMIDDNWLTVGQDWPEYRKLFAPGSPDFEHFLEALRRCTATLVYSPVLAQHVLPLARRLVQLEVNVDCPSTPPAPAERFLIGYAGTARYSDAAFVAATRFVEAQDGVALLYCGLSVPPALAALHASGRLEFHRATSYHHHRAQLRAARPSVLIAPLDICETSRSKCPNKFLEITAAGAVGVYTEIEPYVPLVEHGVHGLIIPAAHNDDWRAWHEAYTYLLDHPSHRQRMVHQAAQHVAGRFDTRTRYPAFLRLIEELVGISAAVPDRSLQAA